ncbi:hypothetical protein RIF29_27111 [Crotalaria pallida]|uniref:FAS1 domain-containing protein n=1 Tax=Crotalaria pallida TaxID=3830 RepID=A0AAN9HYG7_CROPI
MSFKNSSLLCFSLLLAFSCAVHAFDITKLLKKYPELSTFNNYLTQTNLAAQINSRNTITVLAVDNDAASSLSGKSQDAIKAIISTHVVLDYFDQKKLTEAIGGKEQLTTLYQSSGLAVNQQGFIKVELVGEGNIGFGSAVKGAHADAELVKTVTAQPYNISILQISKLIVFPGADSTKAQSAKAPVAAAVVAKAPVSSKTAKAPASSRKVTAPSPSPSSSDDESATADSPGEADAPEAATPSLSPSVAEAPGPAGAADGAADAQAPSSSSSSIKIGLVGAVAVMSFASLLVTF